MHEFYLAKFGKVWQHIKTGETLTNKIALKDGERIADYRQVSEQKEKPVNQEPQKQTNGKFFPETEKRSEKGEY